MGLMEKIKEIEAEMARTQKNKVSPECHGYWMVEDDTSSTRFLSSRVYFFLIGHKLPSWYIKSENCKAED